MNLFFVTAVKDGMPFLPMIYSCLRQLPFEWTWNVVEGTAGPKRCTSWVAPIDPGLSTDGTTEYLDSLEAFDRRVRLCRSAYWHGKVEMFNVALEWINEPCLLWEMDADEIWTPDQIAKTVQLFKSNRKKNSATFFCRYFVGPDIVITTTDGYGNNSAYEWSRVWRVHPGVRFKTHEPPCLDAVKDLQITREETAKAGIVFDHLAWAVESQVRFKCHYYGSSNNQVGDKYKEGVEGWKRLQDNRKWPVDLKTFLPWVGDGVIGARL
jgi:hypothetical protein